MNIEDAGKQVAESGRMLLDEGLTARTWGNISCRVGGSMLITPSGLGYESMTGADVVTVDLESGKWSGSRKPSSEKGIHIAAYAAFPEAGFVIHTHQTYASAISLAGFDALSLSESERAALGGIALAEYGLPGTKKLAGNVEKAFRTGAHTVLMAHHGAVIAGRDREESFRRARLLEDICRRSCRGLDGPVPPVDRELAGEIYAAVKLRFPHCGHSDAPEALLAAATGWAIPAQLDDMAQMIGRFIPLAKPNRVSVMRLLKKSDAVLVPGAGIYYRAGNEGDLHAVRMLAEKACVSFLHARDCGADARLSAFDTALMRTVYLKKYSKKAAG